MQYRVLIVGTVPYNEKSTSRAFDAYFHYMDKKNLAQIFLVHTENVIKSEFFLTSFDEKRVRVKKENAGEYGDYP